MCSASTYLSFFNYINQLMKKMAPSYYDFQGPYVLGAPAGAWLSSLPLDEKNRGQDGHLWNKLPPNFLHPEIEVKEGKGKKMKVTGRCSNAAYSRPLPHTVPTGVSLSKWTSSTLPRHAAAHDKAKDIIWRERLSNMHKILGSTLNRKEENL